MTQITKITLQKKLRNERSELTKTEQANELQVIYEHINIFTREPKMV